MLVLGMKPFEDRGAEEVVITTPSGEVIVVVLCEPHYNHDLERWQQNLGVIARKQVAVTRRPVQSVPGAGEKKKRRA